MKIKPSICHQSMTIYEFDPAIYPINLWVCIGEDFDALNGIFSDAETDENIDFSKFKSFKAVTVNAIDKETGDFGVLIVIKPEFSNYGTIAHEASHAAGYIFYHVGADMDCGEPTAYLIEWIVKCCEQIKLKTFECEIPSIP